MNGQAEINHQSCPFIFRSFLTCRSPERHPRRKSRKRFSDRVSGSLCRSSGRHKSAFSFQKIHIVLDHQRNAEGHCIFKGPNIKTGGFFQLLHAVDKGIAMNEKLARGL